MLQQDGRLVIRSNVTGVVYGNVSTVAGNDSSGSWVLRLSATDGSLSISDIVDSRNVLWSNYIGPNQTKGITTCVVVGVTVGVSVLAMAGLALLYFNARTCKHRLALRGVQFVPWDCSHILQMRNNGADWVVRCCVMFYSEDVLDPAEKAFRRRLEITGMKSQKTVFRGDGQASHKQFREEYRFRWIWGCVLWQTGRRTRDCSQGVVGRITSEQAAILQWGEFLLHSRISANRSIVSSKLSQVLGIDVSSGFLTWWSWWQIELLSAVHHKYLVSLLGYRCTRKQQILIYEYINGSDLRSRLQGVGGSSWMCCQSNLSTDFVNSEWKVYCTSVHSC